MNRRGFLKSLAAAVAAIPAVKLLTTDAQAAESTQPSPDAVEGKLEDVRVTRGYAQYDTPRTLYMEFSEAIAAAFKVPQKCVVSDVGGDPHSEYVWGSLHRRVPFFASYIYDIKNDLVLKDRDHPVSLQIKRGSSNEYIQVMSASVINQRLARNG